MDSTGLRTAFGKGFLCLGLMGFVLVAPAQAVPTITLAPGVANPPPNMTTTGLTPPQTAIADTATLVPAENFTGVLQATLNAQGFTNANGWTLAPGVVTLGNNATFNITDSHFFLDSGGNAFGETMDFTLNPDLAAPANVPGGSTATLHWLQYVNTDAKINGYGFPIAGQQGFWQVDNGQKNGGAAAGAGTGPYYDSNPAGRVFSTPPTFSDGPQFYSGVGTYLHFDAIPTWDVFTPAIDGRPAAESIDVADYGLAWGFQIVPEPGTASIGLLMVVSLLRRNRR